MAASKTNFFKDHYDWLVAAVGLAAFAGVGVLFVMSLDSSPEAARAACEKELVRTPSHKDVPAADLSLLNKVRNGMERPSLLVVPSDKEGNFLASECRVFCQNPDRAACHKPIPFKSKVCPFCGFKQPSAEPADVVRGGVDADKDGMPDAWELKYGLNPNDPEDAKKDLDGDSFTSLEEFEAKTDPKNPDSHPEFLDFLAVAGQLNVESLKFCFDRADATSSNPKDGDWRITFSLLRDFAKEKGFNARVSTMVGKEIVFQSARPKIVKGKMIYDEVQSGWRVVKYNKKTDAFDVGQLEKKAADGRVEFELGSGIYEITTELK